MTDFQKTNNPTIVVAATFTVDPLLSPLKFVLREAGLPFDVELAPYNQIFQELLSSTSRLATSANGVNVVLVRIEDFVREVENIVDAAAIIKRTTAELESALAHYSKGVNVPTVFAVNAASPRAASRLLSEMHAANTRLVECARSLPGIIAMSAADLTFLPTDDYDSLGDELAHVPYSEEGYASIAIAIARKVHALRVPARKVLVLDCDGTLWRGVVGEDGIEGITISKGLTHIQQYAVNVQERGALVCLVSKNTEKDVLEVFENRSDMILKLEHIAAHRINWESKPHNIASLAKRLNLGLDSFVFLDDSPVECSLMRAELPQVVTLQVPEDDEIESFLSNLWVFDKVTITDEDARRTSMYREDAARQKLKESAINLAEFVASLGVEIQIDPPTEEEWARLAQLTHRTNQFNFSAIRRTEAEMRALWRDHANVLRVKVRDRFGDYGLVGLVILEDNPEALGVDTLLLSCRVLGRGVEHAILNRLGEIARQRALPCIDLRYKRTARNEPARAFAESVAGPFRVEEQNQIIYRIPVDVACTVAHQAGHDLETVIKAREPENHRHSAADVSVPRVEDSERHQRLALMLRSPRSVLDAVHGGVRLRSLSRKLLAPSTDTEHRLLALWQEVLGISRLGVEDNYFELGGTSLMAVRLMAEVWRHFGVKLPLTTILESPTVRGFSRRLNQERNPNSEVLIELRPGGSRKFFFVHDGDGETLLYLNLARRMPPDLAVFGIEPRHIAGFPLAHGSIEDMAAFYVGEVRKKDPYGPYLLGGMCAGGVIAYEMASQLVRAGETVELVVLLDAAAPSALKRPWRTSQQRLVRFNQVFADAQKRELTLLERAEFLFRASSRKMANALLWEVSHRCDQWAVRARFRLLRELFRRERQWPKFVPELTVRQIYNSAERSYKPKPLSIPSVVLVRARSGEGSDTPYKEVFAEETLGWGTLAQNITIVDVDGGHSTMLQEQFVDSLADALMPFLQQHIRPLRERFLSAATM